MAFSDQVREFVAQRVRRAPAFTGWLAKYRRRRYENQIAGFLSARDGKAGPAPAGLVYEATMRCNLHCEFCYVGDLLNIEGEWRQELPLEILERAFPDRDGLQVSFTGGEIFMRKDMMSVMEVFQKKGYSC